MTVLAQQAQQQAAWMEVDGEQEAAAAAEASSSSLLDALPFPIGWQLLCDCLPTPDILRLASASRDCQAHARPCVRRLAVHGRSSTSSTSSSTSCTSSDNNNDTDDGAAAAAASALAGLVRLVAACPRVEEVHGVALGPLGAAQLAYAWSATPTSLARLRCLALPGCKIGEPGLARLLPLLGCMPCLERLDLDGNALGSKGARTLARALDPKTAGAAGAGAAVPSTEEEGVVPGVAGLPFPFPFPTPLPAAAVLPPCARLRVLSVAGNVLGPSGTAALARAFRHGGCPALRELHLRNNDVRGEGLRELLGAFAAGACPELSTLNLDSNIMGASGALFLARAFRDGACQNLQVLNLNSTFIGERGTRELADAFKAGACRALQRLYLRSACLPDSGLHELVAALQASSSSVGEKLQVLVLGRLCSITVIIINHDPTATQPEQRAPLDPAREVHA